MHTVVPWGTVFYTQRTWNACESISAHNGDLLFICWCTVLHILILCGLFMEWKPSAFIQSVVHLWLISQQGFIFYSRKHNTVWSKISKESKALRLYVFQLQRTKVWCGPFSLLFLWTLPVHHCHLYLSCGSVMGTVAQQLVCSFPGRTPS